METLYYQDYTLSTVSWNLFIHLSPSNGLHRPSFMFCMTSFHSYCVFYWRNLLQQRQWNKRLTHLCTIDLACRLVEDCEFGAETMKKTHKLKRDKNPQRPWLQKDIQMFLRTSAKKNIQDRLPLNNVFLQNVHCLQPSQHVSTESRQMITAMCDCMPQISTGISFIDNTVTEWCLNEADTGITSD